MGIIRFAETHFIDSGCSGSISGSCSSRADVISEFVMNHQDYSRYATIFTKQSDSQAQHASADNLLRCGGHSVSRSAVPSCSVPVDWDQRIYQK